MKKLDRYQCYAIVVTIFIVIAYFFALFFLPVAIDDQTAPTVVNGITTSMSVAVALGGAVVGIVFRGDIEKGDTKTKRFIFTFLGIFVIALGYPWGSYLALATKSFTFAVRYSLGGYLIAFLGIIMVYVYTAKRWDQGTTEDE